MPSDSNGNYSLPDGYLAQTGQTILASQHNPPLEDLASSMSQRLMATGAKPLTGPLKLADGLVGAPGLSFASSPNSGLYRTSTGNVGIVVNGVIVAEFVAGGGVFGARSIGELFYMSGTTTTPPLCVRPYGQALLRASYPALWTFAQSEIAAGNTFYNNGNGSTTFGIGDLRGVVLQGRDNMGGAAANRVTQIANNVGASGGAQFSIITTPNLPAYTPSGSVSGTFSGGGRATNSQGTFTSDVSGGITVATFLNGSPLDANTYNLAVTVAGSISGSLSGTPQGGNSTPMTNLSPRTVVDICLFAGA